MDPRQSSCSTATNRKLCCEWGEREEDAKPLYTTVCPGTEVLASQLQVAVENIIWDQKPELSLQALLLIC